MGKIYNLYLDESETHDNSIKIWINKTFAIGGIIVEDTYANNQLKIELDNLKYSIWGDSFPNYKDLVLHEKEVKDANNGHKKYLQTQCKAHNKIFHNKSNVIKLYTELEKIIRNGNIITLGACIKHDELNNLYSESIQNDRYLVALQIILENYVHFLCNENAKGRIIYEHNGENQIKTLRMKFNMIKTLGTLFISPEVIQEKLIDIDFPYKSENIPGLQIADFIPNVIVRKHAGKKLEKHNIYKTIKRFSYKGSSSNDKFGIKVLP